MSRPRLLDLFCGAGGAAMGYYRAGFDVVGVDIKPMPRYPFEFHQGDALEYAHEHGAKFDAIHASPPCQAYSNMRFVTGREYPDLIVHCRSAMIAIGKPYVIENVVGAPLIGPIMLCGITFGLKVFRHRLFETSFFMLVPPHCSHVSFGKAAKQGRPVTATHQYMTVTGNFSGMKNLTAQKAMGIDWMSRHELSQAIPPAYTEFIGHYLFEAIEVEA